MQAQLRGRRLALVFGIADYGHPDHNLPAAAEDAVAVARLFRGMGYTLIRDGPVLNATKEDMRAALGELAAAVQDGCTVVVYFAGHGLEKVLLPVDADVTTPTRK